MKRVLLALALLAGWAAPARAQIVNAQQVRLVDGPCRVRAGAGSPEGSVTGNICDTYFRSNGGTDTTIYVKESGSGNTGWVALGSGSGSWTNPMTSSAIAAIVSDETGSGKLVFDTTPTFTTSITINNPSLGVTVVDGVVVANATAATSGVTEQVSPVIRLRGSAWKSNATAASQTSDWYLENTPHTGATTITSELVIFHKINGSTGGTFSFTSAGSMTMTGGMTWGASAINFFNGRSVEDSPLDGKWRFTDNGQTHGFTLDFLADATAKFRNRADNADAAITTGAITASGNVAMAASTTLTLSNSSTAGVLVGGSGTASSIEFRASSNSTSNSTPFSWTSGSNGATLNAIMSSTGIFAVGNGSPQLTSLGSGGTYVSAINSSSSGGFQAASNNVAASSDVGYIDFGTFGAASAEKRAGAIHAILTADSTTTPTGDLVFYTTAAGSITEKFRIASDGNIFIKNSAGNGVTISTFSGSGLIRILSTAAGNHGFGLHAGTTDTMVVASENNGAYGTVDALGLKASGTAGASCNITVLTHLTIVNGIVTVCTGT